jgi:hypothetical protein
MKSVAFMPYASSRAFCRDLVKRSAALVFVLLCLATVSHAQPNPGYNASDADEDRIKAAFIYKFLSYVDWPPNSFANSGSPYVIDVLGNEVIAEELRSLAAARQLNGRPVVLRKSTGKDVAGGVHVAYIGRHEKLRFVALLKQFQGTATLIVTDSDGALGQGSMINFRVLDDRVRFEVSVDAAEKSGLKLSSKLLAVAMSVVREPQK